MPGRIVVSYIAYKITTPSVLVWQGPSGEGSAVFYLYAAQDRLLWILISKEDVSEENLQYLDDFMWGGASKEVMWSRGGSVLAIKKGKLFTHAYDFKTKQILRLAGTGSPDNATLNQEHSDRIEELMRTHGGDGATLTIQDFYEKRRKLGYWEWRRWDEKINNSKKESKGLPR